MQVKLWLFFWACSAAQWMGVMPSFWFLPDTLMPSSSLLLHNQSIRKSSFLLFPKYDHKLSTLYKLLQPSTLVQTRVISLQDDGNNLMTLLQSFADSPFSRAPGQCSRFCSPHSLTCNSTDVAEREPWASAVKKSQVGVAPVCKSLSTPSLKADYCQHWMTEFMHLE